MDRRLVQRDHDHDRDHPAGGLLALLQQRGGQAGGDPAGAHDGQAAAERSHDAALGEGAGPGGGAAGAREPGGEHGERAAGGDHREAGPDRQDHAGRRRGRGAGAGQHGRQHQELAGLELPREGRRAAQEAAAAAEEAAVGRPRHGPAGVRRGARRRRRQPGAGGVRAGAGGGPEQRGGEQLGVRPVGPRAGAAARVHPLHADGVRPDERVPGGGRDAAAVHAGAGGAVPGQPLPLLAARGGRLPDGVPVPEAGGRRAAVLAAGAVRAAGGGAGARRGPPGPEQRLPGEDGPPAGAGPQRPEPAGEHALRGHLRHAGPRGAQRLRGAGPGRVGAGAQGRDRLHPGHGHDAPLPADPEAQRVLRAQRPPVPAAGGGGRRRRLRPRVPGGGRLQQALPHGDLCAQRGHLEPSEALLYLQKVGGAHHGGVLPTR
mmetsp:Transcript_40369/g.69605  ORF Transcript_40369/g.69605 Transcript_40369/m.69605 type:complete len:431 (+) Transcript_40369:1130-2422(+)